MASFQNPPARKSSDDFGRTSASESASRRGSDAGELGRRSRTSLNTDVALRLYSGNLDAADVSPALDIGEDLTEYAVDEEKPVLTRVEDTSDQTSTPGPLSLTAVAALQRLNSAGIHKAVADNWISGSEYLRSSWQYQKTRRAAAAAVLAEFQTEHIPKGGPKGICEYATNLIKEHKLEDTMYIYDLGNVVRMFRAWKLAMPRVTPYYAVKCNPEPALLRLLMAMGAGFDCASKSEVASVLSLGMPTSRIIFAHPCKRKQDIMYAAENHIEYTTFDTESELDKIAELNPRFRCVLRIRADDPDAIVKLGLKYGANPEDAPALLQHAKNLGLQVVGVSFHVGSGAKNMAVFSGAIATARHIFDLAELMGFHMELLDIGGGFTGHFDEQGNVMFGDISSTINTALELDFPVDSGVRVIAEPGRFFAETSATMFTPIYGQRDRPGDASHPGGIHKDYWITDGLYGSFNCILYDSQNPTYQVVRSPLLEPLDEGAVTSFKSTIWGPTCDSADCVYKDVMLPELRNGDWLMYPNAGAYTVAGACDFNGINMTKPRTFYVFSDSPIDLDAPSQEVPEEEDVRSP